MLRTLVFAAALAGTALALASPAMSDPASFGSLFHDGAVVGTVVVSQPVPDGSGLDPFYVVTNGASGQLGIAGVAPGDGPYHGGDWQVWLVTFTSGVTPYLLASDEAVQAAAAAGDVTVTRAPGADFRCPLLPNG